MKALGKLFSDLGTSSKPTKKHNLITSIIRKEDKESHENYSPSDIEISPNLPAISLESHRKQEYADFVATEGLDTKSNTIENSPYRTSSENMMVAEIDENQRRDPSSGEWSYTYLLLSDPKRFKSSAGESDTFPSPPLSNGWIYCGHW
jgi:hypothetical protein